MSFKKYLSSAFLVFLLLQGNAFAVGLGFYGTVQGGEGDWEEEDNGPDFEYDDGDTSRVGFGFTFDTAVLKDDVFNYRLNAGFEAFDADFVAGSFSDTAELGGIAVDNSFGFGLLRTENVRLWAGPRVRVAIYGGEFESNSGDDIVLFEFGVGGVIGANFKVGPTVAFAVETGVMFSGYGGGSEDRVGTGYDLTGDNSNLFLNGGVLFMLWP